MVEILIDSFNDIIKVIPLFLIITLAVDWLVSRINRENSFVVRISKHGVWGGGVLGLIPQCGIAVAFAKLYGNGYINLGMLIAVFLASSDEALIIIGAHPDKISLVLTIILIKLAVAIPMGYLINLLIKEKRNRIKGCSIDCNCPKCRKSKNLLLNSLVHTVKIFLFLLLTVFVINYGLEKLGQENFEAILGKNTLLQPIYASLIGMIPSCFSSVFIAESYLKGALDFGPMISGLLANTGYGILVVFKELPWKQALRVFLLVQLISIVVGELFVIFRG